MGTANIMRAVLLLAVFVAAASAIELTPDNFDSATAGKSAFIKFLAPWWGHCKSMKPAWDKLMDEFKDSKTALVGDVDCTVHQDLCDAEQKKSVEEALALSDADLDAKIKEGEDSLVKAEDTFKSEVEKLQARYEELMKEKDETIANVKKSGLGMLKSVKASKAK